MGNSSASVKGCCKNLYCLQEPEHIEEKQDIELAKNSRPTNTAAVCPDAQNQEIIAQHIRTTSKAQQISAPFDQDQLLRKKLREKATKEGKSLKLRIINSGGSLPKGAEFSINPFGLEGSLRNVNDGITYFGCNPPVIENSKENENVFFMICEKKSWWIVCCQ